jgi:heat shock protein HtpX
MEKKICPKCGYENKPDALYCNLCQYIFNPKKTKPQIQNKIKKRTDFYQEMAANKNKSFFLMFIFIALLVVLGYLIGATYGNPYFGLILAVIIAAIMTLITYYAGAKMMLGFSRAKPVTHDTHPQLFNVVEEMKIAAGLPRMPEVYIINDTAPNAFATGRDPEHSYVAVTTGLLEKLNREELQGVIAHEMSHIRNYDIRFSMIAGILLGTIVLISDFFLRGFRFRGSSRSRSSKSSGGGGIIVLIALIFAILSPIFAKMLQMAISRKREFLADASAVELTRNPSGLANALRKIAADREPLEVANRATQHLYIINPVKNIGMKAKSLFSTHPPTEARIRILEAMM